MTPIAAAAAAELSRRTGSAAPSSTAQTSLQQAASAELANRVQNPSPADAVGADSASSAPPGGVLRDIALAGRDLGEGVLDTFAAPHDISSAITNLARRGINRVLGTHMPQVPTFAGQLSNALTSAGAPVPTTPGEKLAGSVIRGASGALTGAGILGLAAPALTTVPNAIRAGLAGVTGGASADIAREAGAGPAGQFVAGLAGGFAPSAVEGALGLTGGIIRPLTRGGQAQIAANTLVREAQNPAQAAVNLGNAAPLVPGSLRTAGEASGDTGILALEKGVRARNPGPFGARISEQNAARQAELANLGGTPADIAAAEQLRDTQTAPMRDAAFATARQARAAASPESDALPVLGARNYQQSDPTQDSIIQFLAKHSRGIDSVEARSQGIDPADFGAQAAKMGIKRAFRNGGMSFDEAAEALHQAGYPVADEFGNYSPNVLLDALDSELRGRPVFSVANTRRFAELEHEMAAPNGQTPEQPPTIAAPVHQTISRILNSPAGARESIGKTMRWVQNLIGENSDPETLYEVRKDLALAQQDRLQPSGRDAPNATMLAQARGQLGQVIRSLDDAIETAAPGYKAYLSRYAELSDPINQMEGIQGLQQKASSGLDTATGHPFLTAPAFSKGLQGLQARANGPMPLRLTPDQTNRLGALREDLQRGSALSSPTVRTPGSDTFQNFMTGRRLGGGLIGHVPVLGKYLRGVNDFVDQRVNENLANAMLDPQYAAALLRRGAPVTPLRARLTGILGRGALPATIGPLAALPAPTAAPMLPSLPAPRITAQAHLPSLSRLTAAIPGALHMRRNGRNVTIMPPALPGAIPQKILGITR